MAKSSTPKARHSKTWRTKSILKTLTTKISDSQQLLRSNCIPKSSPAKSLTVKKSDENSFTDTKEDSNWSRIRNLTMKHLTAKSMTRKNPCVKILLTEFLTKKSYRAKIWLPKFKQWRILQKKINGKSFKYNGKIFSSTKLDEKKTDS